MKLSVNLMWIWHDSLCNKLVNNFSFYLSLTGNHMYHVNLTFSYGFDNLLCKSWHRTINLVFTSSYNQATFTCCIWGCSWCHYTSVVLVLWCIGPSIALSLNMKVFSMPSVDFGSLFGIRLAQPNTTSSAKICLLVQQNEQLWIKLWEALKI
jgi:hypothetical protein